MYGECTPSKTSKNGIVTQKKKFSSNSVNVLYLEVNNKASDIACKTELGRLF